MERPLLCALTKFLSFRGPDAQEVWSDGAVGFGHTMLRTTREAANERQPGSLEGRFWITADVRLDCRSELIETLQQAGRRFDSAQVTDPELLLHAYAAWGEGCVEKLRGDFAFALWDARQRRLFCARDHFGVKPFFYVAKENQFLFSNTLNCLRAHPDVSDELNDAAIGDFLLFGLNCDVATTTFQDVRRLPPAHFLIVSTEGLETQKYWAPPIDGRIRYKRDEEYVEHFLEIFKAAVADRLRTDRVGIFLSGGLDSGSIAAIARELSDTPAGAKELRAYNNYYESLIPDDEGPLAQKTADFLQIPISRFALDRFELFEDWDNLDFSLPEPMDSPFLTAGLKQFGTISENSRVILSGDGGDDVMHFRMWPYCRSLVRNGEWGRAAADIVAYLWVRPLPWRGIRHRFKRQLGIDPLEPKLPQWLAPEFNHRLNLEYRWKTANKLPEQMLHPTAPIAHACLSLPQWPRLFESLDSGLTHWPLEMRYPFLDLRAIGFILAIPPFPWFFRKTILRRAAIGRLPDTIRRRPKTPVRSYPDVAALKRSSSAWIERVQLDDRISAFVDRAAIPQSLGDRSIADAVLLIRLLCLNFWLRTANVVRYKLGLEVHDE